MVAPTATAPTTTQKRLAEFAAHFQVEGHDDVFVLSSTDLPRIKVRSDQRYTPKNVVAGDSPLFNVCLAVLATSAAILALHLVKRHQLEEKKGSTHKTREIKRGGGKDTNEISAPSSHQDQVARSHQRQLVCTIPTSTTTDPPTLISERPGSNQSSPFVLRLRHKGKVQQSSITPYAQQQTVTIASPPRPLKTRVQELVEISKTIDGLSESRALDVAVRLAQIESNETIKLTELAIHQRTSFLETDQKERHHREALEEQGKERQWRQRLDLGFQSAVDELLLSTTVLAISLTCSVLLDYLSAVWNEFKENPLAYTAGLVCEQALVETTSSKPRMWFVGSWAYDYVQATKTDLICGLSIAQYLAAAAVFVGVHSLLPGIVGKGIQHACLAIVLVKVSLRLMELEEVLLGAFTVVLFLLIFGGGVWSYHRHAKSYIGRLGRIPSIVELDGIEDVYDQARLGFVICKVLAGALFLGKAVCLAWNKSNTEH